jgi:DNA-binding response OmpR family regulator
VLEASNGKDGLRMLADNKPHLMLLDVVMPEMDGLAVLKAARALAPLLPVVMLTGGSDMSTAKTALDHGASAYITKPFDSDALCAEVRRLIEGAADASFGGRPWSVRK